jgi:hypothetical protein
MVSSDGGLMLIRKAMQQTGIVQALSRALGDSRHPSYIDHSIEVLLTQRIAQICCGYEDANDSDSLREDPLFKIVAGRLPEENALASQPTMSRLENSVGRRELLRMAHALIDQFIASFDTPPEAIVLDLDPTADHVHGSQQMALFNAYEDEYCFMPFHLYDGLSGKLITAVLRPGKTPSDREILCVLKRVVRRLRQAFPNTRLIFRADSHHTKPAVMEWLETKGVDFITGLFRLFPGDPFSSNPPQQNPTKHLPGPQRAAQPSIPAEHIAHGVREDAAASVGKAPISTSAGCSRPSSTR